MKDPQERNQNINKGEDEISATRTDANSSEKPVDDGFKTGGQNHKQEWATPQDEQMFDNTSPDAERNRTDDTAGAE